MRCRRDTYEYSNIKKTIETYGEEPQIRQCMEECAELISEIVDYSEDNETRIDNILEEMADVLITCKQVEIIIKEKVLDPGEIETENLYMGKSFICNLVIKHLADLIKVLNKYLRGKKVQNEISYQISGLIIRFDIFANLLEMNGDIDVEKQINKQIKCKLNRLKERLNINEKLSE